MTVNVVSLEVLLEHFILNEDGTLCRIKGAHRRFLNRKILTPNSRGYIKVRLFGKQLQAHRIVYQMFHLIDKLDPSIQIDHIDGNKTNNSPSNLRIATNAQNQMNVGIQKNSTSGFKGVCYEKDRNKWGARIFHLGKKITIGRFDSPELAYQAYVAKSIELFGEYART